MNAKPIISYASNAVINQEGEEERINHWVNKKWKIGGDVHAPMENKLKFLYEIGRKEHEIRRKEQVGMYLRNQNIRDLDTTHWNSMPVPAGMYLRNQNIRNKAFDDQYKKRTECEKIHGHIKGTVKFDIRRVRNQSRKLYSLLSFITYQLLVLTEIQSEVGDKNLFGRYF